MARKKELKKNQYKDFPNCFDRNDSTRGRWHEIFGNPHPITFELGCGKAAFIYEMAQRYPERNFVGVDLKPDRLWRPAKEAASAGIHNLAFLCINLIQIGEFVAENEAAELWITFPDPFPKKKQAKHRMVNSPFLNLYQNILLPQGKLHLKTDNLDFFHFTLETLVRYGNIELQQLSFDLHSSEDIAEDAKIQTVYEALFIGMGKSINYLCLSFKPRD
ncbi:MAG: tRNA (guanosine(46)-N7)-methyltransferase TrmB [Bacteroidia bacterium]|nr:tRNA (guanosine(46)-N7)-methyltransferase TrmB [Bacteroidia bacterium]